jgi:hypothetical protein
MLQALDLWDHQCIGLPTTALAPLIKSSLPEIAVADHYQTTLENVQASIHLLNTLCYTHIDS